MFCPTTKNASAMTSVLGKGGAGRRELMRSLYLDGMVRMWHDTEERPIDFRPCIRPAEFRLRRRESFRSFAGFGSQGIRDLFFIFPSMIGGDEIRSPNDDSYQGASPHLPRCCLRATSFPNATNPSPRLAWQPRRRIGRLILPESTKATIDRCFAPGDRILRRESRSDPR